MDLLFTYSQEKSDKHNLDSSANLKVFEDKDNIKFVGEFYFELVNNIKLNITHELILDIGTGDFIVTYIHKNNGKIIEKSKKNDFKLLNSLVESGLIRGENNKIYWGQQYKKASDRISTIFYNKIKHSFVNEYYNNSLFKHKSIYCFMYRLVVNYFLDKKGIKSHDGIYFAIEDNFPAKKWLDKNDNNFLPALLDSYGIRSKFLIKEINVNHQTKINLKTLKYLCNLFGENHLDYIKNFDWKGCSISKFSYTKKHTLRTEHEKRVMVKVINEFTQKDNTGKNVVQLIYNFLSNKDEISKMNLNVNFKYNNIESFYKTSDEINGILRHKKRGYRIRYALPQEFIEMVENPIIFDNFTFTPKVLLTEEDFIIEGHQMKNCMSTQFSHGIVFIYISLKSDFGTVNLQYKNGKLTQGRAKANSDISEVHKEAINILTDRMMDNPDIKWVKEKFDFI